MRTRRVNKWYKIESPALECIALDPTVEFSKTPQSVFFENQVRPDLKIFVRTIIDPRTAIGYMSILLEGYLIDTPERSNSGSNSSTVS